MTPFSFHCPTRLHFGSGVAARAGALLAAEGFGSVLLVTGTGHTVRSRGYAALKESLKAAGISWDEFPAVTADPGDGLVREAAALATAGGRSALVAYGGGSPIDCAKSAALMAADGTDILEYLHGRAFPAGGALPVVAIPTTAGTGSEMSSAAVTTDTAARRKLGFSHECLFPRLAIVDPELHLDMPPPITAATGMDALTHVIESFLSLGANPASDAINLHSAARIMRFLEAAWRDGSDLAARSEMACASALAGAAFSQTGLGMVHGFAHPVGARLGIAHGLANAVILPYVLAALARDAAPRMATLATALGLATPSDAPADAARKLVLGIAGLKSRLGMPASLGMLGVGAGEAPAILSDAIAYRARPRSPRAFTDEELSLLLDSALSGDLDAAFRA